MELPEPLANVEAAANHLYDTVPTAKTGRMVHIGVLRRTDSYNIFTTEGSELNLAQTATTPDSDSVVQRVVMFKRKQVASERRTGKEALRGLYEQHSPADIDRAEAFGAFDADAELCRLHDNLCGRCVDCKLYGFANAEAADGSRHSRVLTDSAFSIRGLERRSDITLNAQSEAIEAESSEALNSRAHTRPETYFPSIISLRDATWRELYWVLYLLLSTTRYGAETSRTGYVENQIAGLWFDTRETISNLELTKRIRAQLGEDDLSTLTNEAVATALDEALPGDDSLVTPDDGLAAILEDVEARLDSDQQRIDFLEALHSHQVSDG